jgi:allophanate hydrolase
VSPVRLIVEQAGPLVTVQDGGRRGLMRFGVPHSGPVDRLAFAAAHAALGTPPSAPAIELSLGGLTIRCQAGQVAFALTGGDFSAELNGATLGSWTTGLLTPGTRLRIRPGAQGSWAYLAFAGRLEARTWLGSAATHALAGLGGGALHAGQELVVEPEGRHSAKGPITMPPARSGPARIVIGPQDRFFTPEALVLLTNAEYRATARLDRMGLQLDGPALIPTALDMVSEPAVRGALQVNGTGGLSLLLADHQTTGGYPKIAILLGPDADRAAQLRPGAPLRFAALTPAQATEAARHEHEAAAAYLAGLAGSREPLEVRLSRLNLVDGVVAADDADRDANGA